MTKNKVPDRPTRVKIGALATCDERAVQRCYQGRRVTPSVLIRVSAAAKYLKLELPPRGEAALEDQLLPPEAA